MAKLKGIEIIRTGVIRGKPYTAADLQEMADNTNKLIASGMHNPPVKLGHDDAQLFANISGLPACGWLENFSVQATKDGKGSVLLADASDVPTTLAEAVKDKRYRKVSAEIYLDYMDQQSGSSIGKVIRAVAFLGADVPEVKGLQDLMTEIAKGKALALADGEFVKFDEMELGETEILSDEPEKSGGNTGDKGGSQSAGGGGSGSASTSNRPGRTAPKPGGKMSKTVEQLQEELEARDAELAAERTKSADAVKKLSEAEGKLTAAQQEAKTRRTAERKLAIDAFVEKNKKKGVLTPALEPTFRALAEAAADDHEVVVTLAENKTEKGSQFELTLKFCDELIGAKIVKFGEKSPASKDEGGASEDTPEQKAVKLAEKARELVDKEAKAGRHLSYADAVTKIAKEEEDAHV